MQERHRLAYFSTILENTRIKFLSTPPPFPTESAPQWRDATKDGLHDLGYVDGRNIVFEVRWAEGKVDRFPDLAAELVGLKVDGPSCCRAAEQRDELAFNGSGGVPPRSTPSRHTLRACCARAASGHAAAAPPSVAKNFRRPMWLAI
jgi:hypothetical protein